MTTTDTEQDDPTRFELPADCTAEAAGALREALLALIDRGETVTVGARSVTRLDAAVAQLLVAFVFSAGDAGVFVNFTSPSPAFARSVRRLGLDPVLS